MSERLSNNNFNNGQVYPDSDGHSDREMLEFFASQKRDGFSNGVLEDSDGHSDREMLEFYASQKKNGFSDGVLEDSDGHSDREMLEFYSSLESEADREKRIAEETGTIDPAKQELVRELQISTFNDETLEKSINDLADEPNAIKQVVEMRLRRSLGDNHTKSLNKEQLHADLKIIDLALEHGIDVGAMRIDAEPMVHMKQDSRPVGKWLDRLSEELNVTAIASLENPDKPVAAHDQIAEIRNKLKDPEETPEEKERREEAEAKTKAEAEEKARKEAEQAEKERQAKESVEKAMEVQEKAYQTKLEIKQLAFEIKQQEDSLAAATQEVTSLKNSLNFFQQRFGKGKQSLAEATQRKATIEQGLAKLKDDQAQKIALLENQKF